MEQVAQIIKDFRNSEKNTDKFRVGVRKFWEENFDADKNYEKFFEVLGSGMIS